MGRSAFRKISIGLSPIVLSFLYTACGGGKDDSEAQMAAYRAAAEKEKAELLAKGLAAETNLTIFAQEVDRLRAKVSECRGKVATTLSTAIADKTGGNRAALVAALSQSNRPDFAAGANPTALSRADVQSAIKSAEKECSDAMANLMIQLQTLPDPDSTANKTCAQVPKCKNLLVQLFGRDLQSSGNDIGRRLGLTAAQTQSLNGILGTQLAQQSSLTNLLSGPADAVDATTVATLLQAQFQQALASAQATPPPAAISVTGGGGGGLPTNGRFNLDLTGAQQGQQGVTYSDGNAGTKATFGLDLTKNPGGAALRTNNSGILRTTASGSRTTTRSDSTATSGELTIVAADAAASRHELVNSDELRRAASFVNRRPATASK